ncbi:MAG: inner membrane CreD family protein, partial [bacterium]
RHRQLAPTAEIERTRSIAEPVTEKDAAGAAVTRVVERDVVERSALVLSSSELHVALHVDHRRKGLLWYDTYAIDFSGHYTVANPDDEERPIDVTFTFPSATAIYDGFTFRVDGQEPPPVSDLTRGITVRSRVAPHAEARVEIAYRSRGIGTWTYALSRGGVAQARNFALALDTDFAEIDFPSGSLSPTAKARNGAGWKLRWDFTSVVTGQVVGLVPPSKLNPGPLAARITYFAPVSLLFFLTVMVMLGMIQGQNLHPMNYFFLCAAFFAFHLLLAYLADLVELDVAFGISAATSIFLVLSYLRLVAGMRRFLIHAGLAQLVYLVLFSYAFFFDGLTGLTITVGAVVTLFVLMQLTARIDWAEMFASANPPMPLARTSKPVGSAS